MEERRDVLCGDAFLLNGHFEVGVELGDAARCGHCLVDTEVQQSCRDAVHVRQFQRVEVSEAQFAGQSLERQRMGDGVAGGESHDADAQPSEPGLFVTRDLVAIAIEAQYGEGTGSEHVHQCLAPRVVDPAGVGVQVAVL